MSRPPPIATIGYERAPQAEVIERLRQAEVELLIDVRAVASSRRAGFSKSLLASSLQAGDIGYLHLRDLGTPKSGRQAARAGVAEMKSIFREHVADAAKVALDRAVEQSLGRRVCLLCYEADPACCHRSLVAEAMAATTGAHIDVDL